MKKLVLVLMFISLLLLSGCKKDAQVNDFIKEYVSIIDEVAEKLDEGDFDAARKTFDDRKENLRAKWEKIKYSSERQISKETLNKMNTIPEEHINQLVKSANNAIKKTPADEEKIKDLVNDITNTVRR